MRSRAPQFAMQIDSACDRMIKTKMNKRACTGSDSLLAHQKSTTQMCSAFLFISLANFSFWLLADMLRTLHKKERKLETGT